MADGVWRDVLLEMMLPAVKGLWTHQICTSKDRLGERGEGEGVRAPRIAAARIPPIATVGSVTSHQHVFHGPEDRHATTRNSEFDDLRSWSGRCDEGNMKRRSVIRTLSVMRSMVSQSCGTFYGRQ